MNPLELHEFHLGLGATFSEISGEEVVANYADPVREHAALATTAGILDLSFRGRLCLTGADRARFLHGQVTNDIKRLQTGQGCYAALVTAKGKMESDLNIYALQDELLLDFEPGLAGKISQRLEKFIVADDVQVVDVARLYGLLTVQGPKAKAVVDALGIFSEIPRKPFQSVKTADATLGEIYLTQQSRISRGGGNEPSGFDLFVPANALGAVADKLIAAAKSCGGCACGWEALETARIEAGIPRFGVDMDDSNIPLECGIESRAVSYTKGCYIGQEIINRIHTIGHVNRELRGLRLADDLRTLPAHGDKLFKDGKEAGYLTSTIESAALNKNIALGYVRREANAIGTELVVRTATGETTAVVIELPLKKES